MIGLSFIYRFINSGIQTFRKPPSPFRGLSPLQQNIHIHIRRCHSDLKALHDFRTTPHNVYYIYNYIYASICFGHWAHFGREFHTATWWWGVGWAIWIRVEITREDLCNRSVAMILYAPTFKLQNLLHSPKPSPTKCNGYFCFHVAKKMHFVAAPLLSSSEAEMHFVVVFFGAQHS